MISLCPILAVLCNFTKERRIYEHIWTYFVYNYILVFRDCYVLRLLCFFGSCFLKLKNALGNEKLVFIFKCMRSSS